MINATQANNGNGSHKPNIKDIEVFEPAFAPGDEDGEKIGWYETDVKGKEGTVIPDSELPPELREPPEDAS